MSSEQKGTKTTGYKTPEEIVAEDGVRGTTDWLLTIQIRSSDVAIDPSYIARRVMNDFIDAGSEKVELITLVSTYLGEEADIPF